MCSAFSLTTTTTKNPEKFYRKDTDEAVISDTKSICASVLTHWTSDFGFVLSTELWSWCC